MIRTSAEGLMGHPTDVSTTMPVSGQRRLRKQQRNNVGLIKTNTPRILATLYAWRSSVCLNDLKVKTQNKEEIKKGKKDKERNRSWRIIINWTFVMLISKADAIITKIRDERTVFITIEKFVAVYRTGKKSIFTSKTSIFISRCLNANWERDECILNISYYI